MQNKTRNTLIEEEIDILRNVELVDGDCYFCCSGKDCACNGITKKEELEYFLRSSLERISDASLEAVRGEELDTEKIAYPVGADIGAYVHCEGLKRVGYNAALSASAEKEKNFTSK